MAGAGHLQLALQKHDETQWLETTNLIYLFARRTKEGQLVRSIRYRKVPV